MNTGFQSSKKSSETSSLNNQNRLDYLQSNYKQNQVVLSSMTDQHLVPLNINQQNINSHKNDHHNESQQKFNQSSCSTSKKSSNQINMRDSSVQNEKINNEKHQNQKNQRNNSITKSLQNSNQSTQPNKKTKLEKTIEDIKMSFYGKRIFIGKGSLSIGEQGKQQMVAFLGLFIPIILFILYQLQYNNGLQSQSVGDSWIICVIITSIVCLILFIYCSISNPGFIAIPLTQKQRHSLPYVQQKGNKEFDLRYCHTCHIYRPLRAHHCKICDLCVIERDHHCPFLNNCVGYNNRKGYVYFLFTTVLIEFFIIAESLFQIIHPFVEDEDFVKSISRSSVIFAVIQCIYAAILVANILSLLIFQFQLISRNRTTDEFRRLIAPDPKTIDIQLNKEFDYGCLKNFVNVLIYKRSPEQIYGNFGVLNREYLKNRYTYYKMKDERLLHQDEEAKDSYKNLKSKNQQNNTQPNHTQFPLQSEQYNQNCQITSIQSKPSFSPFKLGQISEGQKIFFPSQEHKENIQQGQKSNCVKNQKSNSNILIDRDQSSTAISAPQGYTSMTCSDQNYRNTRQSANSFTNQFQEKSKQTSEKQNQNQQKNSDILKQDSSINLNNQQNLNIPQVTSIRLIEKPPSSPKIIQQQNELFSSNAEKAENNMALEENKKSKQIKQTMNQFNQEDNQSQQIEKQNIDKNIIDYNYQKSLKLQKLYQNEGSNINKISERQFQTQRSQTIESGLLSNQALEMIHSGRPLKFSDKKIQSDDLQEENQLHLQKKVNSLQMKNPSLLEFDQNIIFYDINAQNNHSEQINSKNKKLFEPRSKDSYYSQKTVGEKQNNIADVQNQTINDINSINNQYQNRKIISNQYQIQKLENQIFNSNDFYDQNGNNQEDQQNGSYIKQKSNEYNEIQTIDLNNIVQNNFNNNQNFQNNDNVASSRRYNELKKQNSETVNNQYQQDIDHQFNSSNKQHSPYKKKRLFFGNNSNNQQSRQNNNSEQSSLTQIQFNKDNNISKDLSRTDTITETIHKNIPPQDNTTDQQTTINDLQIKQLSSVQKSSNYVKYPETFQEQDDFNYPQTLNDKYNQLSQNQDETNTRKRVLLFENQTQNSQVLRSNVKVNNTANRTDNSPKENSTNINYFDSQNNEFNNENSRKQNLVNSSIQMQSISKNIKLSPSYINNKNL